MRTAALAVLTASVLAALSLDTIALVVAVFGFAVASVALALAYRAAVGVEQLAKAQHRQIQNVSAKVGNESSDES